MTDADIHERWEERAAILEYDAGKSRESAERLAAIQVKRLLGRVPESVVKALEGRGCDE